MRLQSIVSLFFASSLVSVASDFRLSSTEVIQSVFSNQRFYNYYVVPSVLRQQTEMCFGYVLQLGTTRRPAPFALWRGSDCRLEREVNEGAEIIYVNLEVLSRSGSLVGAKAGAGISNVYQLIEQGTNHSVGTVSVTGSIGNLTYTVLTLN